MKYKPIYTEIIECKKFDDLTIIRESPNNYPKGKSNIYAKNTNNEIIWFAALPVTGDIYCNSIQWNKNINPNAKDWKEFVFDDSNAFVVASWNCFTVSINNINGKILHKEFTK
jgi:hypothetical protein